MRITLIVVSKTDVSYVKAGLDDYLSRLKHYVDFEIVTVQPKTASSASPEMVKKQEGELIIRQLQKADRIVLLDERGKEFRSVEFADYIQRQANAAVRNLCFVIGGAFGFSEEVYKVAHEKISLSKMTFNHQMVRLFFTEQLYRAFTILNHEKYHNE